MKKIAILSLLVLTSFVMSAQENFKKCMTTPLMEQELLTNPDYAKGRADALAKNIAWINSNHSKKTTLNIPIVIHIIHKKKHSNIFIVTNISDLHI